MERLRIKQEENLKRKGDFWRSDGLRVRRATNRARGLSGMEERKPECNPVGIVSNYVGEKGCRGYYAGCEIECNSWESRRMQRRDIEKE